MLDNRNFLTSVTRWDVTEKKYFHFRKSLTHFDVLISDKDFVQVSLKSDNSTNPVIDLNRGNSRKNKP